ncbi:MAG: tetratricopeptide repeat protein [Bacteroidota bacterium]
MNQEPQNDGKFDRYLREEMDAEERQAFENLLNEDESLQEEVKLQQDIVEGIGLFGSETLKRQLQQSEEPATVPLNVHRGNPSEKQKKEARPLYFALATAASFGLVLVAVWLLSPGGSSQQMYTAYYQPYPNVVNPLERSEGVPTDAAGQAMYYYEQGNYEQAIALLTQEASVDNAYQFYLGVSYLGIQRPTQAETTLQTLLSDSEGAFYEPALWYISLSRLARNQPDAAKATLQQVVDLQGEYAANAQGLLDEL